MKTLFWILAVFALAAALTVAARDSTGYVLIVLPPYRAELSLNFLIVLLVIAFIVFYLVLRVAGAALSMPSQVSAWRRSHRQQKARATLTDAVREFFSGRYARAEKAATRALEMGEQPGLSAVVAARSAHELRAFDRRDGYLARAATVTASDDPVKVVAEAGLLLEQRRAQEALDVLRALRKKHTAALRLELRAQQQLRNWEAVLALVPQLEKRDVLDAQQAEHIRRHALIQNLERAGRELPLLEAEWKKVPSRERRQSRVAAAAARRFAAAGACGTARDIVESSLAENWDSELVGLYADCDEGESVRRIERAERWLEQHASDSTLLLALGRLCARQELWGKAQSYLDASIAIEPTCAAHLANARLQEKLGNIEAARDHYRKSLDLALKELETVPQKQASRG